MTHAPARPKSEPDHPRRHAPLFAGLPGVVWALCLLFVATMLFWSIAKATYNSPDERAHVGAALYWSEFREWPDFKDMGLLLSVMRSEELVRSTPLEAATATARPDRPSFADLTERDNLVSLSTANQMSQHPPLYYVVLGQVHDWLPSGVAADLEVWIMRAVSILLVAPLPLLAAALARRLGGSRPIVITTAAVVALTPGFATVGGAVNNDNLLNAASGWVMLGVGCVLTGDLRVRTATWIGLALAVALLTKAFALPLALGVGLAYLVAAVRFRATRTAMVPLAVAVGIAALGGWWWVRNVLQYGTLQPAGHGAPLPDGPLTLLEALPVYADRFARVFASRFWAGTDAWGLADPRFWISAALSIAILAILIAAPVLGRRPVRPGARVDMVVLMVPFVLSFVILLTSTYRLTMNTGHAAGIQGRYLYSAVLGMIVVAVFALAALVPARLHPMVMLAVTLFGLTVSVWRMTGALADSWAPGAPQVLAHIEALLAWSPLPFAASVAVLVLVVASALLVAALVLVEYVALRRSDGPGGDREAGSPADRAAVPVAAAVETSPAPGR